tara:strand:- start:5034 stop:6653 length:1620 start_codon:yes stop_codon:yes gene_type:complete
MDQLLNRILSLQNRNPLSSTYGCFDRNYWHYKTIIDFPSATYQQVILGLSKLYHSNDIAHNQYQSDTIANSIKSGLLFWCKIQNSDGSHNEYYENDRSFCPTAFTAFAAAESYFLNKKMFTNDEKQYIKNKLYKSCLWLSEHKFPEVQNQMIASMNSIYFISKILSEENLKIAFQERRSQVINAQDDEGWFSEYGGADIGYCFKSLDLFSKYISWVNDPDIYEAVKKLLNFITYFIHPDGTAGGSYGSRSTSHIFPYGIKFFAEKGIEDAQYLFHWYQNNYQKGRGVYPSEIDDKYASYFYFNSIVESSLIDINDSRFQEFNNQKIFPRIKSFEKAGLLCINQEELKIILSWKRNGVIKIFYGEKLIYSDNGYIFKVNGSKIGVTQESDSGARISLQKDQDNILISIAGKASIFNDDLPLVKWIIPFKIFCKTFLKIDSLGYYFNRKIKKIKIEKSHHLPIEMLRNLNIEKDKIIIEDRINLMSNIIQIDEINLLKDITITHSPSSRFFQLKKSSNDHLTIKDFKNENYLFTRTIKYRK